MRISNRNRIARALVLALLCGLTSLAAAQTPIQLNREYTRLEPAQAATVPGKIEVIEFFYYGCPICYELEPVLSRWQSIAPDYVKLTRIPALSSENWESFAKLFYALEATGDLGRLHFPIYDNFHFDSIKLNDEKVMLEWITRNKVDAQKFTEAYASDGVKAKVETARKLMHDFNIRSVPTLIVDGKFVTSARLAGSTRQIPSVLNQLIEVARKERSN
jgi:thiol:disulfide interchange protein DsbA